MTSPVKETKTQHQVLGFTEVVERHKGSLVSRNPSTGRIRCTSQLGGAGFHFGAGPFVEANEIDTEWIDADPILDAPWLKKVVKADYNVYFGSGTQDFDAGQIIRYVHPASGEDVTFQVQQLQWTNDLDQISPIADPINTGPTSIVDSVIRWDDAYGTGLAFEWNAQTVRFTKNLIVDSLSDLGSPPQFIIDGGNPVLRLPFIFQKSAGVEIWVDGIQWDELPNNPLTTAGHVEFRLGGETLWYFNRPTVADRSRLDPDVTPPPVIEQRIRKTGPNLFVEVRVPWSWLETAVYPVVIDPTIDEQVGAGGDDGGIWETAGFQSNYQQVEIRRQSGKDYSAFFRFTGVTIDANVDASYIELWLLIEDGTATQNIYGVDEDAPAAPTSHAEFDADPLTDTSVAWDDIAVVSGFDASPSLNTIFQELTDSYAISGEAVMVQVITDSANNNGCQVYTFDNAGNPERAAKLHIESSAGGVTISMGVATLASSAQGLNVIPGAKGIEMQETTLASSPQAMESVTAVPPAQTINIVAATLVSSAQSLNEVIPGGISVELSEAILASSLQTLDVLVGAIIVYIQEATLVSSPQALSVSSLPPAQTINMQVVTLTGSAQSLSVIPGAISVSMIAATLASSPQTLVVVTVAPQTISMGYATLASSAQTLVVAGFGSPQTVSMEAVSLASSVQSLSLIIDQFLSMGYATLISSAQALVVSPGAISTQMSAVTLASSAQSFSIIIGGVTVSLSTVSLAISSQTLGLSLGGTSVSLGAITLTSSPQSINIFLIGPVSVQLSAATLISSAPSMNFVGEIVIIAFILFELSKREASYAFSKRTATYEFAKREADMDITYL